MVESAFALDDLAVRRPGDVLVHDDPVADLQGGHRHLLLDPVGQLQPDGVGRTGQQIGDRGGSDAASGAAGIRRW